MLQRESRLLPRNDQSSWLVSATFDGCLVARRLDSAGACGAPELIGSAHGGWDVTLDAEETPWVVYTLAETGCIAARRSVAGIWSPALQVSAESGRNPIIRGDEFANVWVFWERTAPTGTFECRACRMGPRSGQEMVAASFDAEHRILDGGCRGGVIWLALGDIGAEPLIVCGTEHDGFQQPTRIAEVP